MSKRVVLKNHGIVTVYDIKLQYIIQYNMYMWNGRYNAFVLWYINSLHSSRCTLIAWLVNISVKYHYFMILICIIKINENNWVNKSSKAIPLFSGVSIVKLPTRFNITFIYILIVWNYSCVQTISWVQCALYSDF